MGNSNSSATDKSPRREGDVMCEEERPDAATDRDDSRRGVEDEMCEAEPELAERPDTATPDFDASLHSNNSRNRKASRKGRSRKKKLSIQIPSSASSRSATTSHDAADATGGTKVTSSGSGLGTGAHGELKDDELDFLSGDLAPGQDPHYVEFFSTRMENRLKRQLEDLKSERAADLKQVGAGVNFELLSNSLTFECRNPQFQIESHIASKWKERNQELQSQMEKLRQDIVAKQTRQRLQLQEKHKQVLDGDRVRIEEAERVLKQKQSLELETKMNRHRQDSIQRGLPNNGMVEWQSIATDLQRKHMSQRQQFEEKKLSQRNRTEQDMETQSRILESHHKRRTAETEANIKKMLNSARANHDAMKAQLLDLHTQRFREREDSIKDALKDAFGVENEKRPVRSDPVAVPPQQKNSCDETDSTVQLVVELQNEGIIIIARNREELDPNPKSKPCKCPRLFVSRKDLIQEWSLIENEQWSRRLGLSPMAHRLRGFSTRFILD